MRIPRVTYSALVVALLSAGGYGHSQPAQQNNVECVDDPACSDLLEAGKQQAKAGQFEQAKRSFEQAYRRVADPLLLWKLARLFDQAGRLFEARTYYQKYLNSGDTIKHAEAEQRVRQLQPAATAPPPPAALVQAPAAEKSQQPAAERPHARRGWLWAIGGISVGVAGIALGVGLGLAARRPNISDAAMVRPYPN